MRRALVLAALLGLWWGLAAVPVHAQATGDWSALGTYTQVVVQERQARLDAEYEQASRAVSANPWAEYWNQTGSYYLDRSFENDTRLIENLVPVVSASPDATRFRSYQSLRTPNLFLRQRTLDHLLYQRQFFRQYYPWYYYPPRYAPHYGWGRRGPAYW